jgi:hypothetical protein
MTAHHFRLVPDLYNSGKSPGAMAVASDRSRELICVGDSVIQPPRRAAIIF